MSTPAEAVSKWFDLLQAGDWSGAVRMFRPAEAELCRLRTLAREFRMMQYWHDYKPASGVVIQTVPPEDDLGPDPALVARWKDRPISIMGVSTAGGLLDLPTPVFLERHLALHCSDEDGLVHLPWGGTRVEILNVTAISDNEASVRYGYRGQSADELDAEMVQVFQRPWKIQVYREGSEWLLEVPYETMGPLGLFFS